jgi:dipeptide/tripeptide permease
MACAEMLFAPISLSLVSDIAPPKYAARAVGTWYFCTGIAFLSGGLLADLMETFSSLSSFFSLFLGLSLVAALIMGSLAKMLTRLAHQKTSSLH